MPLSGIPKFSNRTSGWVFALIAIVGSIGFLAYVGYKPGPSFDGHWTRWLPTIGLAVFGFFAMLASLVSLRSRRWAAILALAPAAAIFLLWAWGSYHFDRPGDLFEWTPLGRWLDECWLAFPVLLVPGLYWLFTRKAEPTLARPVHFAWKITGIAIPLALVPVGSVLMSICLVGQDNYIGDLCLSRPPFTAQQYPRQAVFTARVLGSFQSPRLQRGAFKEHGALILVKKTFWGLSRSDRGLGILLISRFYDRNPFQADMYFVEADRLDGSLTRFLPIFRDHSCTRTAPLQDAEIQLRVLRDGLPSNGIRILGETVGERQKEKNSNSYYLERVPHVNVTIEGFGRDKPFSAVSDENGVYDISGLPPGGYRAGFKDESGKMHWNQYCCNPDAVRHSICECTVFVH